MTVLDTSALLFWSFNRSRLTSKAQEAIDSAENILISSMSFWEIALKAGNGKLAIPLTTREIIKRLSETDRIQIISVDTETWLQSVELDWPHRDPADRAIVALAQINDASLVTSDRDMRSYYAKSIW